VNDDMILFFFPRFPPFFFSPKVFSKSISCLSKIGNEVFLECMNHELKLSVLNSSQSVYTYFKFDETFFENYTLPYFDESHSQVFLKCRLSSKTLLHVFKSKYLHEGIENVAIQLHKQEPKLIIRFYHQHGKLIERLYK
jgi:cell cycle checkpoint control protein RAD9A